jgi:small subunit ribosomal protein S8
MVIDNISNLIISLKNASVSGKDYLNVPSTKMNTAILNVLKENNFITDFSQKDKDSKKIIKVILKYEDGNPVITDVKRISKNSRRVYKSSKEIKNVKRGYGISVLSTPNGVLSSLNAREQKVGGELLFEIW